jgi:hypothetical protein
MPSGRGSWYSQFDGKYHWSDGEDAPNSNALGVPDWAQGVSFFNHSTLGHWFSVTAPNAIKSIEQQTEIGPNPHTGRDIDISAAAAERFGYSPHDFPTDAVWTWEPAETPASVANLPPKEQAVAYRKGTAAEPQQKTDATFASKLVNAGTNHLHEAQQAAARALLNMDGEHYPSNGCAITASKLLKIAGLDVGEIFLAIDFGHKLEKLGWKVIPVGQQQAGDIGSTCSDHPRHGIDHVFTVLKVLDRESGELVVADNQASDPHIRWTGGHGKSPTTHFLRSP